MRSIKTSGLIRGLALLILTVSCGGCYWGCGGGPSSSDPNRGFDVVTLVNVNGSDITQNAHVIADFQYATGTLSGTFEHFDVFTNTGMNRLTGAKVPAVWRFAAFSFTGCPGLVTGEKEMKLGDSVKIRCFTSSVGFFNASPDSVDVNSPPTTGTITGQGISTTYGMPSVTYYTDNGTLAAEQTATSVAPDGSWLQGPVPDFSSAYNGLYTLLVLNKNADGTSTIIGSAYIEVTGFFIPTPPPTEQDPCDCSAGGPCTVCGGES